MNTSRRLTPKPNYKMLNKGISLLIVAVTIVLLPFNQYVMEPSYYYLKPFTWRPKIPSV